MLETLRCNAGHDFTRERVRGPKPHWCPDHRPTAQVPAPGRTEPQEALPESVEPVETKVKPAYSATTIKTYVDETQEVLDHPRVNEELKTKLRYIITQMKSGRREPGDVTSLNTTRKLYMNDARRAMGRNIAA